MYLADKEGTRYALKILEDKYVHDNDLSFLMQEVDTLKSLDHPNIVKLVDYNQTGTYTSKKGKTHNVFYLVTELCTGGELFDIILASEKGFSEDIARYFFTQI